MPAPDHTPQASPPHRPLRVLVADDEPMILKAIEHLLQRRGHHVDTAVDAFGALELLGVNVYDAVMLDARMPGGGKKVLDRLREISFDGVQVLMTGGVPADVKDVHDDVRHLQKPFPFRSLIPLLEGGSQA